MRAHNAITASAAFGAVVAGSVVTATSPGMQSPTDVEGSPELTTQTQPLSMISGATVMAGPDPVQTLHTDGAGKGTPAGNGGTVQAASAMTQTAETQQLSAADIADVESLHKAERLAAELAAEHAAAARAAAYEAKVMNGGGDLGDWIAVALKKMDLPQSLAPGVRNIIMEESRGNPQAINRWDSNAAAGRPSQGLMQTIPSTFRAFVLPELSHLPVTHPVANITAGVRYMVANYGMSTLRAGGRTNSTGNYIGY